MLADYLCGKTYIYVVRRQRVNKISSEVMCVYLLNNFIYHGTPPQWTKATSLSKTHDHIHTRSVGLLWKSDQPDTATATFNTTTLTR